MEGSTQGKPWYRRRVDRRHWIATSVPWVPGFLLASPLVSDEYIELKLVGIALLCVAIVILVHGLIHSEDA